MISDAMLRKAAAKSNEAYVHCFEKCYDAEHPHEFSAQFEKRIGKLKRKADHPLFYRSLRSAASILLALLLAGSAWLAVDVEARTALWGWIKEFYEIYFVYRYENDSLEHVTFTDYRPAWLPDGYTEFFVDETGDEVFVVYTDENGLMLKFKYIYNPNETDWLIDASQVTRKQVTIKGNQADLLISTDPNTASAILWTDSDNTAFYISGFLNEVDLIKIAASVQER